MFCLITSSTVCLAYCFKCSNSLSWCMIPSFCMHHQERSRSRIIKYLQITFSDNAAIELIFWLIFWVTYNWLAKIGRCSYNATVATHYFKSYLSSNIFLHWYRWKVYLRSYNLIILHLTIRSINRRDKLASDKFIFLFGVCFL